MKQTIILFLLITHINIKCTLQTPAEEDSKQLINIMKEQITCWNKGDINCFMQAYWQSDSLKFIGKNGITYGWQNTLDNYKIRYPDKSSMGVLDFDILSSEKLGNDVMLIIGKWYLKREKGDIGGHFSLIWKKINGKWLIVADHTS
ncbi:nuclear transport factor 2 family protein [bacterium AH-315-M05]|nr:nuclear transport factor 2 family protein [bacterium AH-315-M05]